MGLDIGSRSLAHFPSCSAISSHESGDEGLPTGGGRRRCPPPAPPLEDDDLLSGILLRLPPTPFSLPRVSLVCKRWRRLVSDRGFLGRFRARHRRSAPLLGLFAEDRRAFSFADPANRAPLHFSFTPTLDPPDRIPGRRFSLRLDGVNNWKILGCRHGLVLLFNRNRHQVLVWDPFTGEQRRIAPPPGFSDGGHAVVFHGAVLGAAGGAPGDDAGHSTPFLVVLVGPDNDITWSFACVYSSETGIWSNLISTACQSMVPLEESSTLVGCCLYWLLGGGSVGILELDLDRQCLAVIDLPLDISSSSRRYVHSCFVMPAEGGGLGLLYLPDYGFSAELWKRKTGSDGVAQWVLGRTIELDKLLPLSAEGIFYPRIIGVAEKDNVLFLGTNVGAFMIQLESKRKIPFKMLAVDDGYPFASIYTAGELCPCCLDS